MRAPAPAARPGKYAGDHGRGELAEIPVIEGDEHGEVENTLTNSNGRHARPGCPQLASRMPMRGSAARAFRR